MPPATKVPFKPARKDPSPRNLDGSAIWARLKNRDPDRFYVWVNKGDSESLATYEFGGYTPELYTETGPKLMGGRTGAQLGQQLEMRGMLLYSISRADHARLEQEGLDGDGGQQAIDQLEARIVDKRGYDPLRGIRRNLVSLIHEIEAPRTEVGIP